MNAENLSLGDFTEALSSSAPTPGGGGAGAMCAALSVSLCSMAANLTIGKKKFAELAADHRRIIDECELLRKRALLIIDRDAELFKPLSELYSAPKDTEGYDDALETATLFAAKAPMELLTLCRDAALLIEEMSEKCSKLLISDVGCAAALCNAAMSSAAMNVYVNTASLKNREKAREVNTAVAALLSENSEKMSTIANSILGKLRDK